MDYNYKMKSYVSVAGYHLMKWCFNVENRKYCVLNSFHRSLMKIEVLSKFVFLLIQFN